MIASVQAASQQLPPGFEPQVKQTGAYFIKQGRELMVGTYDTTEIQGERTLWVHGKDDEHYLVHREIDEPVEVFKHKHISVEYGIAAAEATGISAETKGVSIGIEHIKAEVSTCHFLNKAIGPRIMCSGFRRKMTSGNGCSF